MGPSWSWFSGQKEWLRKWQELSVLKTFRRMIDLKGYEIHFQDFRQYSMYRISYLVLD